MTAPKVCENCGAALDAGEVCTCGKAAGGVTVEPSTEFIMGDSLEQLPATIDFNFEALKLGLTQSLARYDGLVITEDDIKGAKEDRAKLNKLKEALETKRKEVKKECMAPYTEFEGKVKELVALVDKPIAAIDTQLKGYEDRRREEKRASVLEIYHEEIGEGEMSGIIPFDRIWRDEWYNVSASAKKIRESIVEMRDKASSALAIISTLGSEFEEAVKIKYLETLDLNAALAEGNRLKEEAEKLRAYNARKEAMEKLEAAAPKKAEEPAAPAGDGCPTWEPGGGTSVEEPVPVPEEEKVYRLRFECTVTKAQAGDLSAWLKANNINYRRI